MISRLFDWLYVQSDTRLVSIITACALTIAIILSFAVNDQTPAIGAAIVSLIMLGITWCVEHCERNN